MPLSAEVPRDQTQCAVSPAAQRLTCLQHDVHLWVEYGPRPLQFRIAGLTNPTIVLENGSHLTVTVANLSLMSLASLDINDSLQPPFHREIGEPASGPWAGFPRRIGNAHYQALPHVMHGTVYTITLQYSIARPGAAYYLNVFTGRARAGAWGKIVVVP